MTENTGNNTRADVACDYFRSGNTFIFCRYTFVAETEQCEILPSEWDATLGLACAALPAAEEDLKTGTLICRAFDMAQIENWYFCEDIFRARAHALAQHDAAGGVKRMPHMPVILDNRDCAAVLRLVHHLHDALLDAGSPEEKKHFAPLLARVHIRDTLSRAANTAYEGADVIRMDAYRKKKPPGLV